MKSRSTRRWRDTLSLVVSLSLCIVGGRHWGALCRAEEPAGNAPRDQESASDFSAESALYVTNHFLNGKQDKGRGRNAPLKFQSIVPPPARATPPSEFPFISDNAFSGTDKPDKQEARAGRNLASGPSGKTRLFPGEPAEEVLDLMERYGANTLAGTIFDLEEDESPDEDTSRLSELRGRNREQVIDYIRYLDAQSREREAEQTAADVEEKPLPDVSPLPPQTPGEDRSGEREKITALLDAAETIEQTANRLERLELWSEADQLREQAAAIRERSRDLILASRNASPLSPERLIEPSGSSNPAELNSEAFVVEGEILQTAATKVAPPLTLPKENDSSVVSLRETLAGLRAAINGLFEELDKVGKSPAEEEVRLR